MQREIMENPFVCGGAAVGDSFFGRETLIRELEEIIIAGTGQIHVVGPTRIGKSSLVQRIFDLNKHYPRRLFVYISVGDCENAYAFWCALLDEIREQVYAAEIWNDNFERYYCEIAALQNTNNGEFTPLQRKLYSILAQIAKCSYRLVLALDEFDAVEHLFGQSSHYFQTIRTIYDSPKYATSGVLISRRRLQLFEAKCPAISTFHGVFPEKPITPFSDTDMEDFFTLLDCFSIKISTGGKKRLMRYTGNMPYLCCMFGSKMFAQREATNNYGDKEIDQVFRLLRPQIDRHYNDLIKYMETDGHLEAIYYLSIGAKCPSTSKREKENMEVMGLLLSDKNEATDQGDTKYYAFSREFMTYLRLSPLKLHAWETISEAEKRVRAIIAKECPQLDSITYHDLWGPRGSSIRNDVETTYPNLQLNWGTVKKYSESLLPYVSSPTILSVMTLSKKVDFILTEWVAKFYKYFDGNTDWQFKLEKIRDLRNPMAHGQLEYIGEDELAVCLHYCEELIRMKY